MIAVKIDWGREWKKAEREAGQMDGSGGNAKLARTSHVPKSTGICTHECTR